MVTEHCLLCGEKNGLQEPERAEAFECNNCGARFWIDDTCKLEYMVRTGCTPVEAELALKHGKPVFC